MAVNPVLEQVRRWREGSLWSSAIYGGRALRTQLVMESEPLIFPDRIAPEWIPETVDQRIERVIASIPEICPNCNGTGDVQIVGHDGDQWFAEHEPCPSCFELVSIGEDEE